MRFKLWLKYLSLYLSLYLLIPFFSMAVFASQPQTSLEITPKICVVKKSGDECTMKVNVRWQSSTANDYCLYQDELALKCWLNAQQINTNMLISLHEDMSFTLRKNTQVMAQKEISVSAIIPQKYRRKLRADWSVF